MKLRSMEEKISYRLFLMGFLGLIFTAALCIFVFHSLYGAGVVGAGARERPCARRVRADRRPRAAECLCDR